MFIFREQNITITEHMLNISCKKAITLIFILLSLVSKSQTTLQFVDSEAGEPICGLYSYIYKNGNTFADCGASNKNGYKKVHISNFDSLAIYQISVSNLKYEAIWKEIDLTTNDTLVIALKKNDYYKSGANNLLSCGCNKYSFLNYYPREPRNLSDLPIEISEKVTEYLMNRTGENYPDFTLIGGQIIELDEYKRRNPKSNGETAYYLCFAYRNMEAGIAMYSSKIELDESGNIIKDIGFPKIKEKITLVSLSEIKSKAFKESYYKIGKTKFAMDYLKNGNILVWKFVNETDKEDHTFLKEEIYYNAHNGQFIRIDTKMGEWID